MKNQHHDWDVLPRMIRFGLRFERLVPVVLPATQVGLRYGLHLHVEKTLHALAETRTEQGIQDVMSTKRPPRSHLSTDLTKPASLQGAFECEQRWNGKMLNFL